MGKQGAAPPVQWQPDLETATKLAAQQQTVVLMHFTADWCRPCKELETFVYSTSKVRRVMQDNVVAVKIDVDQYPEITKSYGVAAVPFDVIITPKGRVVSKRSSPRDSSAYFDMIKRMDKVITELAKGNPGLDESLDGIKDEMGINSPVIENNSFTPNAPSHSAPNPSAASAQLHRKSKVSNPYAATQSKMKKAQPQRLTNQYAVQSSLPAALLEPTALPEPTAVPKPTELPKPNAFLKSNQFAQTIEQNPPQTSKTTWQPPKIKKTVNQFAKSGQFTKPVQFAQPDTFKPNLQAPATPQAQLKANNVMTPRQMLPGNTVLKTVATNNFVPPSTAAVQNTFQPIQLPVQKLPVKKMAIKQMPVNRVAQPTGLAQQVLSQEISETGISKNANQPIQIAGLQPSGQSLNQTKSSLLQPLQPDSNSNVIATANINAKLVMAKPSHMKNEHFSANSATAMAASQPTVTGKIAGSEKNVLPENVALQGKCPVTLLHDGQWVAGDEKWGCIHRKRLYLFTSEANLKKFQNDPDAFSPLLAGFDPVVFKQDGKFVDGTEEHGVFMGKSPNQRVVLFSSAETRAEFQSDPRAYIETIRQAMKSTGGSSSNLIR